MSWSDVMATGSSFMTTLKKCRRLPDTEANGATGPAESAGSRLRESEDAGSQPCALWPTAFCFAGTTDRPEAITIVLVAARRNRSDGTAPRLGTPAHACQRIHAHPAEIRCRAHVDQDSADIESARMSINADVNQRRCRIAEDVRNRCAASALKLPAPRAPCAAAGAAQRCVRHPSAAVRRPESSRSGACCAPAAWLRLPRRPQAGRSR
jgi:hypothetical protein